MRTNGASKNRDWPDVNGLIYKLCRIRCSLVSELFLVPMVCIPMVCVPMVCVPMVCIPMVCIRMVIFFGEFF